MIELAVLMVALGVTAYFAGSVALDFRQQAFKEDEAKAARVAKTHEVQLAEAQRAIGSLSTRLEELEKAHKSERTAQAVWGRK